jgi:hypothetical protein
MAAGVTDPLGSVEGEGQIFMALIEASCHCGVVRLRINRAPEEVTDCNCTICRRYGALWAYYSPKDVQVINDATDIYLWGNRAIEFHRCKHCGCITHWAPVYKAYDRMGVNARLMAPEVLDRVRLRRHDGANTGK